MSNFSKTGAALLNYVNRSYCKKIIILLPGQTHPEHFHKIKEETFFVVFGSMQISLNGVLTTAKSGDTVLVEPGTKHWFSTTEGVIFEEISSKHFPSDSFYTDINITSSTNRKTLVTYWFE